MSPDRTTPTLSHPGPQCKENFAVEYAHSLGLGGSAAGDLLDTELVKLGLQLLELGGELLLVLAPELGSLDLGRLGKTGDISTGVANHAFRRTYHGGGVVLSVVGVEN